MGWNDNLDLSVDEVMEKADHDETLAQVKFNLHQSIMSYIDTFGEISFKQALNTTLKDRGLYCEMKIGIVEGEE